MPAALLRPCSVPGGGCPALTEGGPCPRHSRVREARRGSAHARGYTRHWREVFIPGFIRSLIAHGIAPVCGAALPGGPSMGASLCKAEGRLNGDHLHLDHDPPLRDDERGHRHAVEDAHRVGFLCRTCHSSKTKREQTT